MRVVDETLIAEAGRRLAAAAPDAQVICLHRTLRDLRMPADVIVVSRPYVDRWWEVRGGLVHAALSQGRVLVG